MTSPADLVRKGTVAVHVEAAGGAPDDLARQRVARLGRYSAWMWDKAAPWVGDTVLEVRAGLGTMTRFMLGRKRVVVTESNPAFLERLRQAFGSFPHVSIRPLDVEDIAPRTLGSGLVDTVIALRVLEHVEDDERVLARLAEVLRPGGRIVLSVPALEVLYGSIDRAVGHRRRYSRSGLLAKVERAGYRVEHVEFYNIAGVFGWWLNSRVLCRQAVPSVQARINDWLVPLLRLEARFRPPFGLSLLVVARTAAEPPR